MIEEETESLQRNIEHLKTRLGMKKPQIIASLHKF